MKDGSRGKRGLVLTGLALIEVASTVKRDIGIGIGIPQASGAGRGDSGTPFPSQTFFETRSGSWVSVALQ